MQNSDEGHSEDLLNKCRKEKPGVWHDQRKSRRFQSIYKEMQRSGRRFEVTS